jgi:hypothetical protein
MLFDTSFLLGRDNAAEEFAGVFRSNHSLTNVELAGNRIGDAGAKALAEALKVPHENKEGVRIGRNVVLSCNNIGSGGMLELQRAMKMSDHLHTLSVEGMRVPFARRAGIFKDSATAAVVDLTGSRQLPRVRLEAIHHEREDVDLEAKVNSEFKPKSGKKLKLSANIKDSFFPVDRFMQVGLSLSPPSDVAAGKGRAMRCSPRYSRLFTERCMMLFVQHDRITSTISTISRDGEA